MEIAILFHQFILKSILLHIQSEIFPTFFRRCYTYAAQATNMSFAFFDVLYPPSPGPILVHGLTEAFLPGQPRGVEQSARVRDGVVT